MKDYEVISADHKRDLPAKGEWAAKAIYAIELRESGDTSGITLPCEIFINEGSPPPQPGEVLKGEIIPNQNPDYAPRFKKEFKGGGGAGGGTYKPRNPSEIAGARHAHNLLVAAHSFTALPNGPDGTVEPSLKRIQERLENLEAFACELDEKTAAISDAAKGQPKPKEENDLPF